MRPKAEWVPRLSDGPGSRADRLASALAEDISSGRVGAGHRLPAHRDLAYRLGIAVGTVTKAYGVLERRGLVRTEFGRGTFAARDASGSSSLINLAVNTPPRMLSDNLLARTLATIGKSGGIGAALGSYQPAGGSFEHRVQMAHWLSGLGMTADPDQLLLCAGAQHALSLAFSLALPPQGLLVTERFTYPGALELARHVGLQVRAVEMDGLGMMPEALDRTLEEAKRNGERPAVYVTPTLQNPTAATMDLARRIDIVAVCGRHDVPIIEDDVYAMCMVPDLPPLGMLAPERTFYINGLSKTLSPGLRIGVLVPPPFELERATSLLHAGALMVPPLSALIMEAWLTDGTALSVLSSLRAEATARSSLARSILGERIQPATHPGFHAWLPMPVAAAEALVAAAAASRILLTPPRAVTADAASDDSGVRVCLGSVPLATLREALLSIDQVLTAGTRAPLAYV